MRAVNGKALIKWSLIIIIFAGLSDSFSYLINHPIIPKIIIKWYTNAHSIPLLYIALVIAAPLSEEIVVRGFMFKGLQSSRLGTPGAIILTSLLWSIIHLQYDIYIICTIFLGGLLLGYARYKSKSLFPPVIMHMTMNLTALIETTVYVSLYSPG